MKVILKILILKCLLCIALASPKNRIQKFSDSSPKEKIGDYNVKDILKKIHDDKDFEFYQHSIQEHTLKENDRRREYVRYYFKKPSNTDVNDSSDSSSSYDSSAEAFESLESEMNSDNNSEKSKHSHTKDENSNSSSSEESESHSHEENVDEEDKEENSKIKSLLKKLNKSFYNKQALDVKDTREVNTGKIFRESTITKWREMEIIVKLLLIDNYKYTKKVLRMDIFNSTQSNQHQIFRLEHTILQEYYSSKKDIFQMVELAKKKCKKVAKKLSKKKTYEVEQLYFSQLKDQIDQKVVVFKQNIKSAIDQLQLESKSTSSSDAIHSETTDIQNVSSIKQPIDHENNLPPVISIISAVNITTEDMPKSLWTENGENNIDLDGAVVSNQGAAVRNEQDSHYFSQEISASLVPFNILHKNGKDNQVENNSDIDTKFIQQKPSSTVNYELTKSKSQPSAPVYSYVTQHPRLTADIGSQQNKAPFQITNGKFENDIDSLNTKSVENNGHHSGSNNDQVVTDYINIHHENFTKINKIKTVIESEININPPLNLTETEINNEKSESPDLRNDFSNVDNKITPTKNITTSNHVTSNADSDKFNKTNQIKFAETLTTNNKSISEALGDSNIKNSSPSIDEHIETAKNNSIVKDDQNNSGISANLTPSATPKKNETVESTNIDTLNQHVSELNLTVIKTNSNTIKESKGNSHLKNNSHISENDRFSNNEVVNDTRNSNDYHVKQNSNKSLTNFTEIKINYSEPRQLSSNNQIINNHLQGYGDDALNNSQINYQEPNERNNLSTQSLIPTENKFISSSISEDVNGAYDYPLSIFIDNVTTDNDALNRNKSIVNTDSHHRFTEATKNLSTIYFSANSNNNTTLEYPLTTQQPNQVFSSTIMYKLESSSNFDGQNQKHTISTNATENLKREHQSVEPIDGNIENQPGQRNIDVIPHDVNAENVQNTSGTNEGGQIVSTASINTTNDYKAEKSIDDNNSLTENSLTASIDQLPFELENTKNTNNKENLEKEHDINGPTSGINTTLLHLNSPTPPNNIQQANITQPKTENQFESESTTGNHLNNNFETTVAALNTYSINNSSDYLLSDYNTKSTLTKNVSIISTDKPVTETNINENLTKKSSDSSIRNQHSHKNYSSNKPYEPTVEQSTKITEIDEVTTTDNNNAFETQSEKIIQIDLTAGDNHYNELSILHNETKIKKSENEIILNDPTKIIFNKTSTIDSSSYGNEEIATNSTKVSDRGYFSIDVGSNLDTTTNKDFHAGLGIETITKNESEINHTSIPTPQIDSEPTESTVASIVTSENIITGITTEGTIVNTTIYPVNKINTNECKDGKGTVIDCDSLILSDNIKNTNTDTENKKSTVNVWPGIPDECLSLFLASDGTVLKEIPSIVNISDAQTRNLCVSIAITIIQLNSSHNLL